MTAQARVTKSMNIYAPQIEVLSDHDEEEPSLVLVFLGLNIIVRVPKHEALRVADDIKATFS